MTGFLTNTRYTNCLGPNLAFPSGWAEAGFDLDGAQACRGAWAVGGGV